MIYKTRTPIQIGGELIWSERVSNACSTSVTRRVNLVTNPVISHEWGKNPDMLTTSRIVEGGGKIDTPNTQAQDQFDFDLYNAWD
jgi:hypothetical protein